MSPTYTIKVNLTHNNSTVLVAGLSVTTTSVIGTAILTGKQGPIGPTDHTLLTNIGTNTHAQIDTHLASTANPHAVTKTQVGLSNVPNTDFTSAVTANTAKVSNATHTGDVTGATALTIAANAVTNAKMATMVTKTYKGNTTGATAVPTDVPVATLKTDLALTKTDVGLANVDNTADTAKPVSTAQQTAINLKADDNAVVKLTGAQTIAGAKTLSNTLRINSPDVTGNLQLYHTGSAGNGLIESSTGFVLANTGANATAITGTNNPQLRVQNTTANFNSITFHNNDLNGFIGTSDNTGTAGSLTINPARNLILSPTGTVVLPASQLVNGVTLSTGQGTSNFLRGDGTYATPAVGGSGTVTSVSVTTANGVSGSVATATTTPAISLTLGAITPTTVNSVTLSGSATPTLAVTGTSAVSNTNTGDNATNTQYSGLVTNATHTGEVTGSGALTIAANAVTNAKMATMATKTYKGNTTGGTAAPTDVAVATLKTDLALVKADVGLGNVDNTTDAGKPVSTAQQTALNLKADDNAVVKLTGAQTVAGAKTFSTPIATASVATMSASVGGGVPTPPNNTTTFLRGDGTFAAPAGSGDMVLASAQTVSGAKTFLDTTLLLRNVANTFNGSFVNTNTANRVYTLKDAAGTVAFTSDITGTNSGTNTGDNATNTQYSGLVTNATHTGDVTGATALTIANSAVTLGKMANLAANSIIGNNTGVAAAPLALTTAQTKTLLAIANTDVSGLGTLSTQSGTFSGTSSNTNTGDQTITLTGDVTGTGTGSFATNIAANAVINADLAQMATKTYKGRTTAATGNAEDVPVATLKTDLVLVKADVGLGNVDNTTDANKPVSTAQQTALNAKRTVARVTFGDANYTIAATSDTVVAAIAALTAPRTVTLPLANTVPAGTEFVVSDQFGSVSVTNTITIARAGADTINGATSEVMSGAYGWRRLISDGTSVWSLDAGVVRLNNVQTLTNKTITQRVNTTASSATPAINANTTDMFTITALAANITSMTSGLTGTPTDGQKLLIRIKGTASRTITWGASFVSSGTATLLATTSGTNTHLIGFIYDSAAVKYVCTAVDSTGY